MENTLTIQGDELTERVDAIACEFDRTFFKQHPQRRFRLRPAWDIEIEDFARNGGIQGSPLEGHCWWIVVRRLGPGLRSRLPFSASHNLSPETSEREAREMWKRACPPEWRKRFRKLERKLERAQTLGVHVGRRRAGGAP